MEINPPVVKSPDILSADVEREFVEMEANPEAAPPLVIFHVEDVISAVLLSWPKMIFPEAVKFPPVEIPFEKSPNEAETPEPVCGGEPPPAC